MNENETPQTQTIEIPAEMRRKLDRMVEKLRSRGMPMAATKDGRLANDAYGRVYARERGKGNIRIILVDGELIRAGHRNKQIRKVELKALRRARKEAARKIADGRQRTE